MRRIRLIVAVAATMVAMLAFSIPAMADVDFDGDRHGDRYEDRYDRYEDRLDKRADLIEDYYDELEDAYDEDGFFFYYYDLDDIEDVLDID
jgi:hypothetical protein